MGKSQRDKGARFERELVNLLKSHGIDAKRIPLSGATWLKGDLLIAGEVCECKKRGDGFRELYKWLEDNRYLIVAADRRPPLMVMRLDDWITGEKGEDNEAV